MSEQIEYMQKCLQLAKKGSGEVAPNPMVGCIIVHEEKIIGKGFHKKYGTAHAEVNAINSVKNKELLKSATLYVNLEPCAHYGKTPPCADLIIKYKIPNIVIGSIDPNSLVQGKGIERLIKSGCKVNNGVLEEECKELNKRFYTFHKKKRPYIILKWAQTMDGFIDVKRNKQDIGKPLQISNERSRKLSHKWRSEEQAIMVGTNTALLDNPRLTTRKIAGKNPLRIVIDKELNIPSIYHLFDGSTPTVIFTGVRKKSKNNLEYVTINFNKNISKQILSELYKRKTQSVIIEGGTKLLSSFIEINLWDEARVFVSNKKLKAGIKAPDIKAKGTSTENVDSDKLFIYKN